VYTKSVAKPLVNAPVVNTDVAVMEVGSVESETPLSVSGGSAVELLDESGGGSLVDVSSTAPIVVSPGPVVSVSAVVDGDVLEAVIVPDADVLGCIEVGPDSVSSLVVDSLSPVVADGVSSGQPATRAEDPTTMASSLV
jgi:hypothetical protein